MNTLLFFVEIALILSMLSAIQIPVRRRGKRLLRTTVFVLKLLLIPAVAILFVAIDSWVAFRSGDILCAAYGRRAGMCRGMWCSVSPVRRLHSCPMLSIPAFFGAYPAMASIGNHRTAGSAVDARRSRLAPP